MSLSSTIYGDEFMDQKLRKKVNFLRSLKHPKNSIADMKVRNSVLLGIIKDIHAA